MHDGAVLIIWKGANRAVILEVPVGDDEVLPGTRTAFLVLDLGLDIVNGVGGFLRLEMPAGRYNLKALLVRRNAFLVLDLGLDIVDGVGSEDSSGSRVEMPAGRYKALPVRRNTFLVLDLGLDIIDGVRGFRQRSQCRSGASWPARHDGLEA